MPYSLYRNGIRVSEKFKIEADLWTYARQTGLCQMIVEDEDTAPRTVLNPDLEIHVEDRDQPQMRNRTPPDRLIQPATGEWQIEPSPSKSVDNHNRERDTARRTNRRAALAPILSLFSAGGSGRAPVRLPRMGQKFPTVGIEETSTIAKAKGVLSKVSYRFRSRHGEWKNGSREIYDSGDSAVVIPYDARRGTILLTRQLRIPAFLHDGRETTLEACAGKLEGELAEQRMKKEIQEELGYEIERLDRLFELFSSPGALMEKITFFTCSYSPVDKVSAGGGLENEGEEIEVVEIELQEAISMIADGQIVDAKTTILLQHLAYHRDR